MSSAWEDLGNARRAELEREWEEARPAARAKHRSAVKAAAMARLQSDQVELTEQQLAEREAARREKMRQHDARFGHDFMTISEQVVVSHELARQMGVIINQPRENAGDYPDDPDTGED